MPQVFYVTCPACDGRFPVHPELWQGPYDLLCPFCQHTFPQDDSPLIISAEGERRTRPARPDGRPAPGPAPGPEASAESM